MTNTFDESIVSCFVESGRMVVYIDDVDDDFAESSEIRRISHFDPQYYGLVFRIVVQIDGSDVYQFSAVV